jgi:hypothetical protein
MDKLDELLMSHDELVSVCQTQMEIILRSGLQKKLEQKLKERNIEPGFAQRAEKSQEDYHRERLMLMASGEIH